MATPRVGVIYEPVPGQVSYLCDLRGRVRSARTTGAISSTARSSRNTRRTGKSASKLKPTSGLTITAAAFHITKENVTVVLPDGTSLTQVGGERSNGLQLAAVGKLGDRWNLLANYAYTDTLMSDSAAGSQINGQRALGVPYDSASIWTRYNLIDCDYRTLGVGLGMVYVGHRLGDYYSPLELPSYTRFDAGFFYRCKRLDANLYIENIFDKVYYVGSINQFEVFPGAPTTIKGQVALRY